MKLLSYGTQILTVLVELCGSGIPFASLQNVLHSHTVAGFCFNSGL